MAEMSKPTYWVPTVADPVAGPTPAELAAAVPLRSLVAESEYGLATMYRASTSPSWDGVEVGSVVPVVDSDGRQIMTLEVLDVVKGRDSWECRVHPVKP